MTECFRPEFREQLPELAGDALDAETRARMREHVESCVACAQEYEILRAVHAAQIPVPSINVAKVVRALPPAPFPVRPELPWYRRAYLQMAAALLLVAGGLIGVREAGNRVDARAAAIASRPPVTAAPASSAKVVSSASGADQSAAAVAPASHTKADIALVAGLDELTTDELNSLVKDVDNLAAVPVAEPEQFSPVTAVSDDQGEG